jgi:cysteine desulfurase family protein
MSPRIYLDNAATSWPKPPAVWEAVDRYQRDNGSSYGRGGHDSAIEAQRVIDQARSGLARLIGEDDPRRVLLTSGGTDSLNTALLGLLRPGDHVVATVAEHNAVLRPLAALGEGLSGAPVETTYVGVDAEGYVDPHDIRRALRPNTRLVAVIHASNVTGAVQPVEQVAEIAHSHGALVLVDAAQSVGRVPTDLRWLGADLLAAPTHKALCSPLGLGFLWVRAGIDAQLRPLRYGGAAVGGDLLEHPTAMPHRFEAGSLNVPAIAGLAAALEHLEGRGVANVATAASERLVRLAEGLDEIAGVRTLGPRDHAARAGVVSFTVEGYDPQEFAALLASVAGIECRAGLHCAPRLHEALGTLPAGGAVRFSPGPWTTADEVERALDTVHRLAASVPT